MGKFHLLLTLLLVFCVFQPEAEERDGKTMLVNDVAEELRRVYREDPELSIGARSCVVGDFTWEKSGVGTVFSGYVKEAVERALMQVKEFDLVTVPEDVPRFGKGAADLLGEGAAGSAGMVSGAYRLYGNAGGVARS